MQKFLISYKSPPYIPFILFLRCCYFLVVRYFHLFIQIIWHFMTLFDIFILFKCQPYFKNRHFLSLLDKTIVLFADDKIQNFSRFSVDKVDNSVYKSFFRTFTPQKLWITFQMHFPTFLRFPLELYIFCAHSTKALLLSIFSFSENSLNTVSFLCKRR